MNNTTHALIQHVVSYDENMMVEKVNCILYIVNLIHIGVYDNPILFDGFMVLPDSVFLSSLTKFVDIDHDIMAMTVKKKAYELSPGTKHFLNHIIPTLISLTDKQLRTLCTLEGGAWDMNKDNVLFPIPFNDLMDEYMKFYDPVFHDAYLYKELPTW